MDASTSAVFLMAPKQNIRAWHDLGHIVFSRRPSDVAYMYKSYQFCKNTTLSNKNQYSLSISTHIKTS